MESGVVAALVDEEEEVEVLVDASRLAQILTPVYA